MEKEPKASETLAADNYMERLIASIYEIIRFADIRELEIIYQFTRALVGKE